VGVRGWGEGGGGREWEGEVGGGGVRGCWGGEREGGKEGGT